jgi:RNA polymerase sigma-70 factor (ECF subfamily)
MFPQEPLSIEEEREFLRKGGEAALADALLFYHSKLERIVQFRMEPALRSRIDTADVLQESYLQISRRAHEFIDGVPVSLFVWIRQRVVQTLIDMQRGHFSDKRNANREKELPSNDYGQTSCLSIARFLLDDRTSPSMAAARSEEFERLQSALQTMNDTDREVLAMRHFEQLSNLQVAEALNLSPTAASNRYIRAVAKLGEIMKTLSTKDA